MLMQKGDHGLEFYSGRREFEPLVMLLAILV